MMRVMSAVLFSAGCVAQVQAATTAPANEPDNVRAYRFKKTAEANLMIHVHLPPGWRMSDKRPAIVFFFGGGWRQGSAEQFARQAAYLAERGMVAARADYRVYGRHKVAPDKCVEDAKSAVRWLREHAQELGIAPQRIVAAGGSAGGHLAACTALTKGLEADGEERGISSRPNALILFNPVLDMSIEKILERLGGDEALARRISPYHNLGRDGPPTLMMFGTDDPLFRQAPPYVARAEELGNRVELYTAEGEVHGFFNRSPWFERTLRRADEFLKSIGYLKGEPTIQDAATQPAGRDRGAAGRRRAKSREVR